jgi:hypothetical protein
MGKFEPGNKAASGRGPNKVSSKVKQSIVQFLENNIDNINEDFRKLKPRERLQFLSDLLPYVTPKLQSISGEIDQNVAGEITITWKEPDVQH